MFRNATHLFALAVFMGSSIGTPGLATAAEDGIKFRPHGTVEFLYSNNVMFSHVDKKSDAVIRPQAGWSLLVPFSMGKLSFDYLFAFNQYVGETDTVKAMIEDRGQSDTSFFRHNAGLDLEVKPVKDLKLSLRNSLFVQPIDTKVLPIVLSNQTQVYSLGAGIGWEYLASSLRTQLGYNFLFTKSLDSAFKIMDSMTHIPRLTLGWKFSPEFTLYGGYQATMFAFIDDQQVDVTSHEPFIGGEIGFTDRIVGTIEGGLAIVDRKLPGGTYPAPGTGPTASNTSTGERLKIGIEYFYVEKNRLSLALNSSVMPAVDGELNRTLVGTGMIDYLFGGRVLSSLEFNIKQYGGVDASGRNLVLWAGPKVKVDVYKDIVVGASYSYYSFANKSGDPKSGDFSSSIGMLFVDAYY